MLLKLKMEAHDYHDLDKKIKIKIFELRSLEMKHYFQRK